jgi:hypothetical protein
MYNLLPLRIETFNIDVFKQNQMKENVKKINRTFDILHSLCWQHWEKPVCIYNVFRGTTAQEMDCSYCVWPYYIHVIITYKKMETSYVQMKKNSSCLGL